jgi:hypothetical protein
LGCGLCKFRAVIETADELLGDLLRGYDVIDG